LCFDLHIDYESLSGHNKADKARELIAFCLRHNRIAELLQKCAELHPDAFEGVVLQLIDQSQPGQETAPAAVYDLVAHRLQNDPYANETLNRWSLAPDSAGARTTLAELLDQALREDPSFAASLRALLADDRPKPGDVITQTVTTGESSQTGDITLTGKIERR
jgi:hypothetical protein